MARSNTRSSGDDFVEPATARARFRNGVLEVTMRTATAAAERGRRIDVEGENGGRG